VTNGPRLRASGTHQAGAKAGLKTRLYIAVGVLVACVACERENRPFVNPPGAAQPEPSHVATSQQVQAKNESPYDRNAWGMAEGKRLFAVHNCVGCHAHGGGAIGPPLMDEDWIYGADANSIYHTIVDGRPDGMPSFRNKIPDQQVWQIVAYVQSMSGQTPIDVTGGRDDHLSARPPENLSPFQGRKQTGHK
jgi:cytochrome c oxidase cbb3-type subunit 3